MAFREYSTTSGKSVSAVLLEYGERAFKALGEQMYLEAQGIVAESKPLVPVDTGALRASGYVEHPLQTGDFMTVELGYGGPAAQINPKTGQSTDSYALFVHENLEAYHKVGTAKFLEMPFDQASANMDDRLARHLRDEMGSSYASAWQGLAERMTQEGT